MPSEKSSSAANMQGYCKSWTALCSWPGITVVDLENSNSVGDPLQLELEMGVSSCCVGGEPLPLGQQPDIICTMSLSSDLSDILTLSAAAPPAVVTIDLAKSLEKESRGASHSRVPPAASASASDDDELLYDEK